MKRFLLILTALALVLAALPAWGEYDDLLGQSFPDFTFTDTDGQVLTLSELLREKELVVISVFATWCQYCDEEFPLMQQIYEKYGDAFELLALSADPRDTLDVLSQYRSERNLSFHFGQTEGTGSAIFDSIGTFPTNIFIDRFGNIGYLQAGMFPNRSAFERTVTTFLGGDYTETVMLPGIPPHVMDVPYPDEAELAAALVGEGIALTCEVDRADNIFPFVPETREGRAAVFASNVDADLTTAHMSATFTAKDGDVLCFEVGADMPALTNPLEFALDGETVKYFMGERDWTPWAIPLTTGKHSIEFTYNVYEPDGTTTFVGIDNLSLLSGDAADDMLSRVYHYPAADATSLTPLNDEARRAVIIMDGEVQDYSFYISDSDTVRVAIRVSGDYDPETTVVMDSIGQNETVLSSLPVEDGVFVYEYPNAGESYVILYKNIFEDDQMYDGVIEFCRTEADADVVISNLEASGFDGVSWSYADELPENVTPGAAD